MKSNTTNANRDFQDFSTCDYTKHWSWSILFKNVFICQNLLDRKEIVEFGAANSLVKEMLNKNFNHDPDYYRYDLEPYPGCNQLDLTDGLSHMLKKDAVVFSEVIEHLPPTEVLFVLREFHNVLSRDGILILTTPTPSEDEMVWPDCHDQEYTRRQIHEFLVESGFEVITEMPWHFRMGEFPSDRGLPPGLERALGSLSVDLDHSTQLALVARKI